MSDIIFGTDGWRASIAEDLEIMFAMFPVLRQRRTQARRNSATFFMRAPPGIPVPSSSR